ncbi:MAG TPA: metallophosphoesterase, partial [Vicinamibacteria bacterium]|nr:metallophosphoesterase [Vicinamibacteria bacterium]
GPEALAAAAEAGVDLTLAGHLHLGYLADVRPAGGGSRPVMVVQAGTAISNRRPHEPNSYNLLTVDLPRLTIEIRAWDGSAFAPRDTIALRKDEAGWTRVGGR